MIIDVKGPAGEIAVSTTRKRHKVTVTAEAASKRSLAVDLARPTAITGTSDYDALKNRPQINGVLLTGDVSLAALGVPDSTSDLINDSGFITADDIPPVPTKTSELENDSGFITAEDIPPAPVQSVNGQTGAVNLTNLVQDLGYIDGEAYDWDIEAFLNTLQETGSYTFHWDEFGYGINIEALEVDETTTIQQIYWGTEEGASAIYYRNLVIENGEIISAEISTYLTFDEANSAFARAVHAHVRFFAQSQSIWDFCNTVALQNAMPIVIYFDSSTNKTYLIEAYTGNRQPVYKMQRVTEMNDMSYFCQRSSYYYSGTEHWSNWFRFSGEVYTPGR